MSVVQINAGNANVFLLKGDGGSVLVDTGLPGKADLILKRLAERGVTPSGVRLILITHGHVDHIGSVADLRERTGAPVAIHALDAKALRRGARQPGSAQPTSRLVALLMRIPFPGFSAGATACEPDVVFEDEFRLDPYGVAARVIPTPGHSPGSVSVLLDSGEAIVGDMVMGWFARLSKPIVAWDLARNWASLRGVLALAPHTIFVGHGGPFPAEDVSRLVRTVR